MLMLIARVIMSLLLPVSGILIIILLGALMLRTRYRRMGKVFIAGAIVVLYLLSIQPVASLLIRPLENKYPPLKGMVKGAKAIVVLTAGVKDRLRFNLDPLPDGASTRRLLEGIKLMRQLGDVPLVLAGGMADPARPELSFAEVLAAEAMALGIDESRLIIEGGSRNTYESALNVGNVLGERNTIVLVTSAFHMERSVRLFQRAGFRVVPAPVAFVGGEIELSPYALIPDVGSLGISSTAVYEYLARGWYLIKNTFTKGQW